MGESSEEEDGPDDQGEAKALPKTFMVLFEKHFLMLRDPHSIIGVFSLAQAEVVSWRCLRTSCMNDIGHRVCIR